MATFQNPSGQSDYTETRDNIITRALRICSVIADEETPTNSMLAGANQALNALVKQWDSLGIHVWTETEGVLFLQPNQYKYEINPRLATPPVDNAAENWRLSNIAAPLGAGDTVITLSTIYNYGLQDIVIGDKIGIVLDTGEVYWALVAFPNPLTLDVGLPSSASGNNFVFLFRDRVTQPLRVVSSRRLILSNRIETPLLTMSRIDYREMPNKATPGTITSFFYDPQLISGFFWVWPAPSDVSNIVLFTFYRRIQDFVDGMNTPDLPQEWTNALTWNLAKELGPEYDVPLPKYTNMILPRAAETLDMVQGFDREPEPTYFGVAFTPSSR